MGERSCLDFLRIFLRFLLIFVNIFVVLCGLVVLIVGIWSKVHGDTYIQIVDNPSTYEQIPVLLIVIGIFVLLLGLVGVVGGVFANTVGGRIMLGLYGFVLSLLVIIEIAGGIAAAVKKDDLGGAFNKSVNNTFTRYSNDTSIKHTWDTVQKSFKCCGTYNYTSYTKILGINPPTSCCKSSNHNCNTTETNNIYTRGCTQVASDNVSTVLEAIAGVAITFGLLQVIGVIVSCFVAVAGRKESRNYQVV
ncbi:PREDICTED: CD63 antigen-like [Amphimedon queenslandica]|uniref:Tetraspanin n=2 Tax=Amphimedon queenslandica TaxID=400682 RepID=A0AAN0IXL0_AMPQE|nr:PREDICTED: CD63 antigen-like [Amphimedon queenslandica]|eukprot:XP_019849509.1 PREDICTED: CD63 antigen-like [Amphimedon queenslandica]